MYHAWFSQKASEAVGFAIYQQGDKTVKATCISKNKNSDYQWPDKEYVGKVTTLVTAHWGRAKKAS